MKPLVLLLAVIATAHPQAWGARSAGCPDVSGHYRPAGSGYAMADVIKALRISVFQGSELRLEGRPEDGLSVWVTSAASEAMPSRPTVVLLHGSDFTCKDSRIVFSRVWNARRKTDQAWYEGSSTVRIAPARGGALGIEVAFSGSERNTLYSYDSARISVPKLGSGTTLREDLRWPAASEVASVAPAIVAPAAPPPEPQEVLKVRGMLDAKLLGNVTLNTVRTNGDAVLVTLSARSSDDVARLEDRLRAASIHHDMKVPPRWTGSGYHLQLLVWPVGTGARVAMRPSVHRVEQELLRMRNPMVHVRKVDDVGDGYVATLGILGNDSVESIVARLRANTDMFADIRLLNESERTGTSTARVAQIKLRAR